VDPIDQVTSNLQHIVRWIRGLGFLVRMVKLVVETPHQKEELNQVLGLRNQELVWETEEFELLNSQG
jgi:hypothetical protein